MAKLIPTKREVFHKPDTGDIDNMAVKIAIEALSQNIKTLRDKDFSEAFLKFIQTGQFAKILEKGVWAFVRKNFVEEQMVRDANPKSDEIKLISKKCLVLPTEIPGNRKLDFDFDSAFASSSAASGLVSGFFKIINIGNNKIKIVSGYDEGADSCGAVIEDNKWVFVDAQESAEITGDVCIFLELGDKTFKTISMSSVEGADISGLRLIGSVKLVNEALSIQQEHIGIIYNNFASEPFDIMLTSKNTVLLKGGTFQMNDTYETIADTSFTVTKTAPIYIETDGTGKPVAYCKLFPSVIDLATARTPIGRVHFADSKITRIEPYVRGWFHCHVIGDCEDE